MNEIFKLLIHFAWVALIASALILVPYGAVWIGVMPEPYASGVISTFSAVVAAVAAYAAVAANRFAKNKDRQDARRYLCSRILAELTVAHTDGDTYERTLSSIDDITKYRNGIDPRFDSLLQSADDSDKRMLRHCRRLHSLMNILQPGSIEAASPRKGQRNSQRIRAIDFLEYLDKVEERILSLWPDIK